MSSFVDTSVVVRYLTGDDPYMAGQAADILDEVEDLQVTDVVLLEAAYVLTTVYRIPRDVVVDHMIAFLQKENIACFGMGKNLMLQAFLLCRPSGRVSFGDAMIWAAARSTGDAVMYSFDERFPEEGVDLRRHR